MRVCACALFVTSFCDVVFLCASRLYDSLREQHRIILLGLRDLLYLADVTDLDFDSEYEITVVAVNNEELTRSSDVWFVNTTSQSMIRFIINTNHRR